MRRHQRFAPSSLPFVLTALTIGVVFLVSQPVLAVPVGDGHSTLRQLERLEEMIQGTSAVAPEQADGLLRQVRYLRHLTHRDGLPSDVAPSDVERRIEALELQIRHGQASTPAPKAQGSLDKVGTISGTVTRTSDGAPLFEVELQLLDPSGTFFYQFVYTDASGNYSFASVEAGDYIVVTSNYLDYIDEIFDDVPCPGGLYNGCSTSDGTPITVVDGGSVQADFALDLGGSISGTLTDGSGQPVAYSDVLLWRPDGSLRYWLTDVLGQYSFTGLEQNTYFVSTQNYSNLRNEVFDGIPCHSNCDPYTGTPIEVTLGEETTGIDFELEQLGRISGMVIDGLSGDPIPSLEMVAYDAQGVYVSSSYSDHDGSYTIGGLDDGAYYVGTGYSFQGFDPEIYGGGPCPQEGCDPTSGTPVAVQLDQEVTGIDFVLEGGCLENQSAMCLNQNRFRVVADWRTSNGNSGKGYVQELTQDSGYFWFFGSNNVEIVVKVLDACTLPGANNFWVFAGGLTDVSVTMTITDTHAGVTNVYTNPQGTPFQPIQDTSAFDTCP